MLFESVNEHHITIMSWMYRIECTAFEAMHLSHLWMQHCELYHRGAAVDRGAESVFHCIERSVGLTAAAHVKRKEHLAAEAEAMAVRRPLVLHVPQLIPASMSSQTSALQQLFVRLRSFIRETELSIISTIIIITIVNHIMFMFIIIIILFIFVTA